jgi:hypothetical protein
MNGTQARYRRKQRNGRTSCGLTVTRRRMVIRPDVGHIADMGDLAWSITGTASRSASSTTAAEVSQRRRARKPRITSSEMRGTVDASNQIHPINAAATAPGVSHRLGLRGSAIRFAGDPITLFAWIRGASADTMGQRCHGQLAERGHPRPSARHCLGPRNRVDTAVRSRAPESTAVVPDYLSAGGGETCST